MLLHGTKFAFIYQKFINYFMKAPCKLYVFTNNLPIIFSVKTVSSYAFLASIKWFW